VAAEDTNEAAERAAATSAAEAVKPTQLPPAPDETAAMVGSGGITLDALIAMAETHHPRLTAAFQRVRAAHGRAIQAGLYPNPKAAVSSPQIDGADSQYNGFISQEFVTAGKLSLSAAAAQQEVTQARYAWQQERFFLITDLRQKFYATLAIQRRVEILQQLVRLAERSRTTANQLFQAGEGSRGDILLLDIELQRAEVALKNAETILEVGKRQLAILVSLPDLMIGSLQADLEAPTREYDLEEIRFAVAAVNPQAQIARLEINRTAFLLQRACVEPIPNVEIMGGYQRQVGNPAADQGLFQVTLAIPLWNGNQGNISAAQAELVGARAELHQVELELANQAAAALANYETASQVVERYEAEILPKARETLELTQNLYARGQIDFLRLLQAQKTLLEAELARIDAQEQRWVAAAGLAGLLQEEMFP
jgi:cobalt-zinc-cadmium efflux system outer membrane protein